MSFDNLYSRRRFIGKSLKSVAGLVLAFELPSKNKQAYLERSFFTMGTIVTISAYGESREHVNHAMDKAIQEIQRVDRLMSLYITDSQLARVNSAAGRTTVKVDEELIRVVKAAKTYHEITGGSFDITVEPLMDLWGFRHEPPSLRKRPSDAEIQSRLDAVGFSHVSIDEKNQAIGLDHADSKIDLGGIAVGFSVDLAVRALQAEGIEAAFINHSGDAYALGKPENDSGWRVGIPNPAKPEEIAASLTLSNKAISTSGNYEKFIEIEHRQYGHIFDPSLGTPSDAAWSTTVIAPTALAADALSTGIFCMDMPRAEKIIAETTGAQAFIVSLDGKLTFLEGKGT